MGGLLYAKTMTLNELAIKYGSDKNDLPTNHGYMQFYESHLPTSPKSILEIGVLEGASMRVWHEAFPDAKLYGLDLFDHNEIPAISNDIVWYKANQLDHEVLYHIRNNIKPEIITEDCSHNCADHWITLFSLIGSCSQYYIEDLHTCHEEFYRQGLTFNQTVLGCMLSGKFPFKFELSEDNKIALIYGNA